MKRALPRLVLSTVYTLMIAGGLLQGCTRESTSAQTAMPATPFLVKTTIREIMDAEIDPAADALWDSVAFTATLEGEHEEHPQTPEQWQAVRRSAITLIEATNLIVMRGKPPRKEGSSP